MARGIDMFDCVLPTRNGRHGLAFTRFGPINLKNARHADDPRPLDEASACPAARDYSRAYLHHLVKANEMLGAILLTTVNLAYYQELMAGHARPRSTGGTIRRAIGTRSGRAGRRATFRLCDGIAARALDASHTSAQDAPQQGGIVRRSGLDSRRHTRAGGMP